MAFTYDATQTTDLAKLRRAIHDTNNASGMGVLPDGNNLSDAELQVYLDNATYWYTAVPPVLRLIAGAYALLPRTISGVGYSESMAGIAEDLRRQADEWERKPPIDDASGGFGWYDESEKFFGSDREQVLP